MTEPTKRAEARALRRKQPHEKRRHPAKSEARPRPLNIAKCEPLHTPRRGQNWKCDQNPLLREDRRTRNLSNSARRCEHSATPSKFFQGITLSVTIGHTLFLNAPWTEHDCGEMCFRRNSSLVKIPYDNRQSKGCMSRNLAHRRAAKPIRMPVQC